MNSVHQPAGGPPAATAAKSTTPGSEDLIGSGRFREILRERHLEWADLPEEARIRHTYLKKHGLSETGLDGLSPRDRAVHEAKIAELTKQPLYSVAKEQELEAGSLNKPALSLKVVLTVARADQDGNPGEDPKDPQGNL
jgi:hypothetical protein